MVHLPCLIGQKIDDAIASTGRGKNFFRIEDENWSKNLCLKNLKEHFANPPSAFINKIKCPVLILHGEMDRNTPPKEALLMQQALLKAGNKNVTAHIFPGLDHSFRRLGECNEDFVTAMNRPLDPVMPEALTNWLNSLVFSGLFD